MQLIGESATQDLGARIAALCVPPIMIHLIGELGSGKTTFAQGFIRSLGYSGSVTSPTFALVETYNFKNSTLYHFDLYRLRDAKELEYLGLREFSAEEDTICLIEWPQRGGAGVPPADLVLNFEHEGENRSVKVQAPTTKGQSIIDKI